MLLGVVGDGGRTAVLREWDQRRDRSPTVCVKTGQRTERAVRVRAVAMGRWGAVAGITGTTVAALAGRLLRRPAMVVVLAVSEGAWRRWRRRLGRAVMVVCFGLGLVVVSVARADVSLAVVGAVVALLGSWMRRRAWLACWVGLTYRPATGEVLVTRTHPAFTDQARRIYVDSVRRHPSPR